MSAHAAWRAASYSPRYAFARVRADSLNVPRYGAQRLRFFFCDSSAFAAESACVMVRK